jgi:predicted CXXCH cytochrome family protein
MWGLGQIFSTFGLTVSLLLAIAPLNAQSTACTKCHSAIQHDSAESRHARMMQRATKQSVEGDFSQGRVVLHGSVYLLRESGGNYYITESGLTGKSWEHRVEYTLGNRRVQHYLTTLPDGRVILIPAAWDNSARKWVHDVDVGNPEEASGDRVLVWNKTCYSCHVSREQKNFDSEHLTYRTTWQDFGVSCESCHGPGTEHIAQAGKAAIVNPAKLDPMRSVMVCAQCHSSRSIYADGFQAGGNYYDYFLPEMEYRLAASDDPAFWADGRPRWFANDAIALWQSQCFLKGGATCVTCHSQAHNPDVERNPQLRPNNNALCTGCHKAIGANIAAHTHHAPASAGSFCVECHMPATTVGLHAQIRDHSMSIPVPENTIRHAIPNACNLCHRDKDAAWSVQQMSAWYGTRSRQKSILRADAFTQAKQGNAAAIPALLAILSDESAGSWLRANAAGYLGSFPDNPSAYGAVLHSFSDRDPLVRATASTAIRPSRGQRAELAVDLLPLLQDPARTVRMSAGIALVTMGVKPFAGEDGERFEQSKELYRARAAIYADDAAQQFAAGKYFLLAGDMDGAAAAFRLSLKLDPATPAQYLLARSLQAKGELQEARQILQSIPLSDSQYNPAQALLAEMEAKGPGNGGTNPNGPAPASGEAKAQFLEGQVRFDGQYYRAALNDFEQALRLAPQADWAVKAQVYRAICLEKLGQTSEAEAAMQPLLAMPEERQDLDLQLAYVELLSEAGRTEEARQRIDNVIADVPNAALAYFWRAKVLLQLQRTPEAAGAAEESIRLQPELPQAHNLLVRIYQMQGRTKEATDQAEWLRDYQRRTAPR